LATKSIECKNRHEWFCENELDFFQLVQELSSNGANLVWEYGLLDPQNKVPRKKPSAKDPLPFVDFELTEWMNVFVFSRRVKADFIRTKYQQMAYINRLKEETNGVFEDLHLVTNEY